MDMASSIETPSGKNAAGENFPVGSWLLAPALRPAVHAFYGFARATDDIADNPLLEPAQKVARLDRFAAILRNLDDLGSDAPSAVVMRSTLRAASISPQHCLDLLTAFKRDAVKLRYDNWDDLIDYCRHSAAPVGRYVLALHGIGADLWPANDALCNALQIINHIQDLADDYAKLDRVYVPQDLLTKHGASTADIARAACTPALRAVLDDMLDQLKPMMQQAWQMPHSISDIRLKLETAVICALAESLVKLLRRRDPLCDNVKLSKPAIMFAVMRGCIRAWL
jgi:hydroxysqualene synthase